MKKFLITLPLFLILNACSTVQLNNDLSIISKDVNGWWTALKALETVVGSTLTNPQATALMQSFGVPAATISDIEAYVGIANTATSITQGVLNIVSAQITAATVPPSAATTTTP